MPRASGTTRSGFPAKGRSVKTSQVMKETLTAATLPPAGTCGTGKTDHSKRAVDRSEQRVGAGRKEEIFDGEPGAPHELDGPGDWPNGNVVFLLKAGHGRFEALGPVRRVRGVNRECTALREHAVRAFEARHEDVVRGVLDEVGEEDDVERTTRDG